MLNLDSDFGSIEPGKKADLVILSADPMVEKDFTVVTVMGTIINGEMVYNNGLESIARK